MQVLSYFIFLIVSLVVQSAKPVDEQHCEGKNHYLFLAFFFFLSSVLF